MNDSTKYSIVIPVYNSAISLHELCSRITSSMSNYNYEVILVDDGSSDNSWQVVVDLEKQYGSKVIGVRFSRNYGQHSAILCGFSFCSGDYIITMDDDLQHPPEEISKLIKRKDETHADVVYGIYTTKHHSAARNAGSFYVRKSAEVTEGTTGYGSSFRLIKKFIIDKLASNQASSFYYLDEMFYWYTTSFDRVEVEHHPRKHGESGYTFSKLFKMYSDIVFTYSSFPLRLMTYAGFVFSLITFATAMVFIVRRYLYEAPFGFTIMIVTVLFTASVLMFCMGIVGQYLFKIYQSQHNRPLYSIREIRKS